MIGRVNAGGGGGLQSTDAILRVIAPAGSTVTISKGGVSKSDLGHENAADHTLYDYYFIIHASQFDSVNPWTVTATLGAHSKSSTIIIDTADEYDMVISYTLWLVRNGVSEFGTITPMALKATSEATTGYAPTVSYGTGYVQIGYSSVASSNGGGGIGYWSDAKIDLSKYSNLHIDGTVRNPSSYAENVASSAWTSFGNSQQDNRVLYANITNSKESTSYVAYNTDIDISEAVDTAYFGVKTYRGTSSGNYTVTRINNCYFEV